MSEARVVSFDRLRMADVERVGGKNASLGEMISQLAGAGIRVPGGFATTAHAYREFLAHGGLAQRIAERLSTLDVDDVPELARAGAQIRGWLVEAPLPPALEAEIRDAYGALTADAPNASLAVRSSATAEDLPDASFAGQQETFLNINGLDNVFHAIKEVFASLYNDRAIAYRVHKGFAGVEVALSAGVQRMVRSDTGASGVMFTLDTESGFDKVVFITAAYGLGETVVQGAVNPDEFYLYKPNLAAQRPAILRKTIGSKAIKMVFTDARGAGKSTAIVDVPEVERIRFSISDDEVHALARDALIIEKHYGRPMDIEWGRDGDDGQIYILQARPETVKSQEDSSERLRRFRLKDKAAVLASGRAIGQKIGQGRVRLVKSSAEMDRVQGGRRAGHGHDRSRLGTRDEAGRGHRHQSRRPDLPRGDHRARTGHSRRRRLRRCDARAGRGRRRDGVVRGGRHRPRVRGPAADRDHRRAAGPDAAVADQDHDERRQSGAGLRVPAPAQRRRGPRPARIHHRPQRRHPPQGAAGIRPRSPAN